MSSLISCKNCQKGHYKHSQRLKCYRNKSKQAQALLFTFKQLTPTPNSSLTDQKEIQNDLDNIYKEISEKKKIYSKMYNQYKRTGLNDDQKYAFPQNQKIPQKSQLCNIVKELFKIKNQNIISNSEIVNQSQKSIKELRDEKKLNRFLNEHLESLLTFDELLMKNYSEQWNQSQKQYQIIDKDWFQSDARSRLRQVKGKDCQSTKRKYAFAWKMLTDPWIRILLSDRFMEAWHDKMFPKFVNPYKFRRLELEFSISMKHYSQQKYVQNQTFKQLLNHFQVLSKELIELKTNIFPPSLKTSLQKLIKRKQNVIQVVQQQLIEEKLDIQNDFEEILTVLPAKNEINPEQYKDIKHLFSPAIWSDQYWAQYRRKRDQERAKRIEEQIASRKQREWQQSEQERNNIVKYVKLFGGNLGFSMSQAINKDENLVKILKIDRQIAILKKKFKKQGYSIKKFQERFQKSAEPSLEEKQAIKRKLTQLYQNRFNNSASISCKKRMQKYMTKLQKHKIIQKRTLYQNTWHKMHIKKPELLKKVNIDISPSAPTIMSVEEPLLIPPDKQIKDEIKHDQKQLFSKNGRLIKRKCLQTFNTVKIVQNAPICFKCRAQGYSCRLSWEENKIYCSYCLYVQPSKESISLQSQPAIMKISTDGYLCTFDICLPPLLKENNQIKIKMNEIYGKSNQYSCLCPSKATCKYVDFKPIEKKLDNFRKNISRVPLEIKKSTIENAGEGMFAVLSLKPQTIIGIYTGFVGTHLDIDSKSNSLFEVGWYKDKEIWTPLILDGNYTNDGTRFVNTHQKNRINVKAVLGIHREEFTILYITTKAVEVNEELFVNYGKNYLLNLDL